MGRRAKTINDEPLRRPPAKTPEARENQNIALAVDLAEKQLRDGTASSQVMSHYLRLSSSREKLEQERLKKENELLEVKMEAIAAANRIEELMGRALDAMRSYKGEITMGSEDEDEYYDD